jgi:hypothetical protein
MHVEIKIKIDEQFFDSQALLDITEKFVLLMREEIEDKKESLHLKIQNLRHHQLLEVIR